MVAHLHREDPDPDPDPDPDADADPDPDPDADADPDAGTRDDWYYQPPPGSRDEAPHRGCLYPTIRGTPCAAIVHDRTTPYCPAHTCTRPHCTRAIQSHWATVCSRAICLQTRETNCLRCRQTVRMPGSYRCALHACIGGDLR